MFKTIEGNKNILRGICNAISRSMSVSHWLPEILHLYKVCTPRCACDSIAVTCCETSNQKASSLHPCSRNTDQRINIVSRNNG